MTKFRILAQSFTSSQRIAKVIDAASDADAQLQVAKELQNASFYIVQISRA